MTDQGFPNIIYTNEKSSYQNGFFHGKSFKKGIDELVQIRKGLMLQKNPKLKKDLLTLAKNQLQACHNFNPTLTREMIGIADGSRQSIENIIILNNYTDFRDIQLKDEGCSTIAIKNQKGEIISGQTWDMHGSAKKYVCTIELPNEWVVFSLVGCLGMMGATKKGSFVGVNNINTDAVDHGIAWPLLVRHLLHYNSVEQMQKVLETAPVTGGHNYILSDKKNFLHFEATPSKKVLIHSSLKGDSYGFHTNHCLSNQTKEVEDPNSISSTTMPRFKILKEKVPFLKKRKDMYDLLNSHEGYPKSICSHYESGAQDPSMTCGGGIFSPRTGIFSLWRGCKTYDSNYVFREYNLKS